MHYLIFEVTDFWDSNGGTITEIKLFNNDTQILYTPTDAYPVPYYWNSGIWDKFKLNDNKIYYTNNGSGSTSSCFLLYLKNPQRFVLSVNDDFNILKMWLGSPEGRTIKNIKIYETANYDYQTHLVEASNDGLVLLLNENYENMTTVTEFTYDINGGPINSDIKKDVPFIINI